MPEDQMRFDSDNSNEFGVPPASRSSDITGLLVKWGLVSSRQEAEYVMVGIAIVALILMFYFIKQAF